MSNSNSYGLLIWQRKKALRLQKFLCREETKNVPVEEFFPIVKQSFDKPGVDVATKHFKLY